MRGRVATHAFTADQLQEALPRGQRAPGNVVRAFRVLLLVPPAPRLAVPRPPVLVLAVLLAPAAQGGSGTAAVTVPRAAAASRRDHI